MQEKELLHLAQREGFCAAALIKADEIVFNGAFRKFCEDNVCGNYGANYSCPPDCGSIDEMKACAAGYERALVLQTKWDIPDYRDAKAIKSAKKAHNAAMFRMIDQMGVKGRMCGASPCTLCERCAILDGEPCREPDRRFSCLSAYCIDVKALAERCGVEYFCSDGRIAFFGIYLY